MNWIQSGDDMERKKGDIPVYYGEKFLFYHGTNMTYESKILICPHCLEKVLLIKDSETDIFHYDSYHDLFLGFDTREFELLTEDDFLIHTKKCGRRSYRDGIRQAKTDKLRNVARKMNAISIMETGYARMSIQPSTFFFFFDKDPVSYIAFDPAFFLQGGSWILKDVYTIPEFRKKGFASKLFEFAISSLKLDVNDLWVSFPISDLGKPLILKFAQGRVTAVSMEDLDKPLTFQPQKL